MNVTRRLTAHGYTLWRRWNKGFKKHCLLMMAHWGEYDCWRSSGRATIAKTKVDLDFYHPIQPKK